MSGGDKQQPVGPTLATASTVGPTDEDSTRTIPRDDDDVAARQADPFDWSGRRLDRYLVLERVGRGGMGDVLLAYDPELDRRVAIKLIRPRESRTSADEVQSRLLREAQALAKLSHPNVVAVHDVGTVDGRIYVAMEYIQGQTLQRWMKLAHPWAEVTALIGAAGQGLAAAHREGIVHRDFKPGNIMLGDDGRVRVLDFGLACHVDSPALTPGLVERASGEAIEILAIGDGPDSGSISESFRSRDRSLTETGAVMGTPGYMAPEQFRGDPVDARTDQFALCIVLYEALYGYRPFSGKTTRLLGKAVSRGDIRKPDRARRVPHRLEAALMRGLSVDPEDRFPTTDALLAEIDRAARPPRWRPIAISGALVVGFGVAIASHWIAEPPCQGAEALIEASWSAEQRDALAVAFADTQLPYAVASAQRVSTVLDHY
ncbi:MAG: serine/threonine protein kinase, partial [Nannocystaceae bacterium]|nr:serine/threonine protein kinase [Nannocystaceae bacterium]